MAEIAGFSLLLALICSGVAMGVGALGLWFDHQPSYRVVRRSLYLLPVLIGIPTVIMVVGFVNNWMNFKYIASNSSENLALLYRLTGLWSGQSGSLLFWALILSLYGMFVAIQFHSQVMDRYLAATKTMLLSIQSFFLILLNFVTYPFIRLWRPESGGAIMEAVSAPEGYVRAMVEGTGMNPVLQHPGMAIHPPILYLGYVGLSVPFCFACGALISGKLDDRWIRQSRIWTMLSWTVLSFGIVLGGWWAYQELGWGGYWAWDPVENASFMPWLLATAFLHSVMVQERRDMLKRWNMFLVCLTFVLSIFGTFLTRSGLLDSVHTFAEDSTVGTFFMVFLGCLLVWTGGLILYRFDDLRTSQKLESILSREFAFLLNNMVLVGICFTVLWGTTYPIISEAITGERVSLGPAFFNQTTIPMFLILLILIGVGPLISWRKASTNQLVRNFSLPVAAAIVTGVILWGVGFNRWMPVLTFSICGFIGMTVMMEFYRGTRARQSGTGEWFVEAMIKLTWKARRRFGGYIVHFSVVIMVIGIAASSAYEEKIEVTLAMGETTSIRGYELEYDRLTCRTLSSDKDCIQSPELFRQCGQSKDCRVNARVDVSTDAGELRTMTPGLELLTTSESPRSRVDIRSSWRDDLYLVLSGWTQEDASLTIYHNPLVNFIWFGILLLIFGGLYAFIPIPWD